MTEQNTWTFDDGLIRSISAQRGQIVVATTKTQAIFTSKGEAHLLGLFMMSQGLREQVGALLAAYRIAWPDPVPSPGSLTVGMNLTIDEVKP
jgi:hypothetical protein